MKLPLTNKYYPDTLKQITKLPKVTVKYLIHTYNLGDTKVFNTKNEKTITLMHSAIDDSNTGSKAISAVKLFNDRTTAKNPILIFLRKGSALLDHDFYDKLESYLSNQYEISHKLSKYLDKDSIIADDFKSNCLHGFKIITDQFILIDFFEPRSFNFTINQLEDMALAYKTKDKKFLNKYMTHSTLAKLRSDGRKFNKVVQPMLYLLMGQPKEYRQLVDHQKLLYVLSEYFKI